MNKFSFNFIKFFSFLIAGLAFLLSVAVVFADSVPQAPMNVSFEVGKQTETSIPIFWAAVPDATFYVVYYKAFSPSLAATYIEKQVNGTNRTTLDNLDPGTTYGVYIIACNSAGCSKGRASTKVTTNGSPPAPAPVGAAPPAAGAGAAAPVPVISELKKVFDCNPVNPQGCVIVKKDGAPFTNLADVLSGLLNIAFYVVMLFAFAWLVWGAFSYITAQGKKEELAKARARITWALIGLVIVFLAYFVAKFAGEIFPPTTGGLPF